MKEPLAPALHLVPEPGHVLQGDLRLGGQGAAAFEGERLGRLEADLLPLQRPGRLLRRYRPQVDGDVHRRARRHQPLQEAGGQGAGPLAQVQRAHEAVSDAHRAPVDFDLNGSALVERGRRAAEGGRYQEHPQLAAAQGLDGQPGPCQQPTQVIDAPEFADRVEAPVENAVAGLQVGEQPPKRFGRRSGLRGQVLRLGLPELLPHPFQARRVLPDEQLRREVEGVERPGEGPQLRLVQLQAHHLADAQLHPVQAHGTVVLDVRHHEAQGQRRWRLGSGWLGLPSASRDSFKQLLQ